MTEISARFIKEVAEHELTIAHDDGLYRHLKFRHTGKCYSGYFWFDLITVPGSLIFRGDGESFVFARMDDMFEFFRGSAWEGRPNAMYWAEKVTSDRERLQRYNEDLFRQEVNRHVAEYYEPGKPPTELIQKVNEDIFEYGDTFNESEAVRLVTEFAWYADPADEWRPGKRPDFTFSEPWEWTIRDYDWWFLWALEAILWGIGKYDETRGRKSRWLPAAVETVELPDFVEPEQPPAMVTVELPGGAA